MQDPLVDVRRLEVTSGGLLRSAGDTVVHMTFDVVRVLQRVDDQLVDEVPWADPIPGGKILRFDGETVVFSTPTGLEYRDALDRGALLHTVALGERALDVMERQRDLLVSTDTGMHMVSPPCPGP